MSKTPDKPEISAIKISRMERSQKTVTQYRALQTDRKPQQKMQTKNKSPLMLILLLKKKIRSRIEYSFMRINIYKNKPKYQKIVTQYLSSILKSNIKIKSVNVMRRLQNNRRRGQNLKTFLLSLSSWIRNKSKILKTQSFNMLSQFGKKNQNKSQQPAQQPIPRVPIKDSRAATSIKKPDINRSVDLGNKSVSASKMNLSKKIDFENQVNLPEQIAKIRRQNQQLKLMELSEDARQALKKVQRFDRYIYAKQSDKVCKDILAAELKRLQKIKNSQKQMRGQFYDNQLSITALYNHIKLIAEMNRDISDLSKVKQRFDAEDSKRKQQQFKATLQNKRGKNKGPNVQVIVKQLMESVEVSLLAGDYDKVKVDLATLLSKYEKQEMIKEKIVFYKSLAALIADRKQNERSFDDLHKIVTTLKNVDFNQSQSNIKSLKQLQKQISTIINKVSKLQNQQITDIFKSFETLNQQLLQSFETKLAAQKDKSRPADKGAEEQLKKVAILQKQLESAKNSSVQLQQYNKVRSEFEKKVNAIVPKIQSKADIRKDIQNLKKDKQFTNEKPYSDFFKIAPAFSSTTSDQSIVQYESAMNFFALVTEIYRKDKIRAQQRNKQIHDLIDKLGKKNPAFIQFGKVYQKLVTTVTEVTVTQYEITQKSKSAENKNSQKKLTQDLQKQRQKTQTLTQKLKDLQKTNKQQSTKISMLQKQQKQKKQSQSKKPISQTKSSQLKTEGSTTNIQNELKQSKQKIVSLEKELKKQRDQSQKKQGKQEDNKKIQEELKKLQQQLKLRKEKEVKESGQKNKEITTQIQLNKSITSISSLLEGKNFKQLQLQAGKMMKMFEKDERLANFTLLIVNLVKNLVERQNLQVSRKKQYDAILQVQTKQKEKTELIARITKQSETQIKSGAYLANPQYWDKYLTGVDPRSGIIIKDIIKILKLLTNQIRIKSQKLDDTLSKNKTESSTVNLTLDLLKNIEGEINKKEYFKSDDMWTNIQGSVQVEDKIIKALFRLIKKFSEASRSRLTDERKLNEKSIKSYEGQLQKMNNFISQYQTKLKEQQRKYQQLYKSFFELQKQSNSQQQAQDQKKSSSLRGSRRSVRSNSSDKDNEIKNIKASIQTFAEDERNMLERLQMAQHEKVALVERINYLQNDLNASFKTIEQLRLTIKNLQKNLSEQHANYQREYDSWKQKNAAHSREIQSMRQKFQKDFEKREQEMVEQFENISKQREVALGKYHKQLSTVQTQLNKQINHLRQQLRLKNVQILKQEDMQVLRKNHEILILQNNSIKQKLHLYESQNQSTNSIKIELQSKITQNGQLQQQISNLNAKIRASEQEINNLNIKIRTAEQQINNLKSNNEQYKTQQLNLENKVRSLQNDLRTSKSNISVSTVSTVSQQNDTKVRELEQQIAKIKAEQDEIINREINIALRNQQEDFNKFLVSHDQQIQQHFFNIVIPQRIRQATQGQIQNTGNSSLVEQQLNQQISKLKTIVRQLQVQNEGKVKSISEFESRYQNQLKITQDVEYRLNQQLRKLKNINSDLENKLKLTFQTEQKIKRYLIQLQITWQEVITGNISEKTRTLYLRQVPQIQTREVIKQVVKEVIKSDPRQQAAISQLKYKLDEQLRIFRDLEQKYIIEQNERTKLLQSSKNISDYRVLQQNLRRVQQNLDQINRKYTQEIETNKALRLQLTNLRTNESNLNAQIRRVQSNWQSKYNELSITTEKKIYEIQQKSIQLSKSKSHGDLKNLQIKLEELNRRLIDESRIRNQLENRYNQSVTSYQLKIQETGKQKIVELAAATNQLNLLREKCRDLEVRFNQKEQTIRNMDQNFRKQAYDIEMAVVRHFQQKIAYYEQRIAQHNNQITNIKAQYQGTVQTFNHNDCQKRYRELEERSTREIVQLKGKLSQASNQGRTQIQLLKQVINNQKVEFKKLQTMMNGFRVSMEDAHRQKQNYFNQLKSISCEKDKEIYKLRTEYENRISVISLEKISLETKLNQNINSQTNRGIDNNSHIKIIELEADLKNKIQEIKHLSDTNERRRRQLEQQHQKLITIDRERQNLRNTVSNMENHIMRLEADISYFNSEIHKYKMALLETQSRQAVIRNDLLRFKTESDQDSNSHLRQQINALKDQILRITSVNINQMHNIHPQNVDGLRITKMIHEIQINRTVEKYGYEQQGELEILKKINQEVSQLVATNRQLQLKCTMLESQLQFDGKYAENINILLMLQDRMEYLMTFLMEKNLIDTNQTYSKYLFASKEILAVQDIQAYLNNWLNFIKSLFLLSNDIKSEELRHKAQQMLQLKEQMNQILDKHIQFVEDQSYETLDKYKMIFSDIRILLRQYMNSRNEEYIQMIWRSLEPHEPQIGHP